MRFPSLQQLYTDAGRSLARFPFVMLSAALATVAAWVAMDYPDMPALVMKLMVAGLLGLPLFVAITLWGERAGWTRNRSIAVQVVAAIALAVYTLTLPDWWSPVVARRHMQLTLGLHLLVAIAPFIGRGEMGGFWEFNKTLFIRLLTGAIYSVVLGIGLSIALLALDKLLGVNVPDLTYARLWIVIAFVFNTWFFLGGVPEDIAELNDRVQYPVGLKVFAQYVLVPIVSIYLVILTAYLVKIIVTRVWPSGWLGYLVSSVSTLGILSLLLVYPIQDRAENKWIRTYGRWFYIALLPSIVMLLLAIWKRVAQYGITENRYFIVVLTLWLAAIALFFIVTRSRNIKVIPASLCLVAFATAFGPWGAYAVSERSQTKRLAKLMTENGLLVDGRAVAAAGAIEFEDRKEISAALDYLFETHGNGSIADWFGDELAALDTVPGGGPTNRGETPERTRAVLSHLDVEYVDRWQAEKPEYFSYFLVQDIAVLPISGFDYAFKVNRHTQHTVTLDGTEYAPSYDTAAVAIVVRGPDGDLIDIPISALLESVRELPRESGSTRIEDPALLMVESDNEAARARAYFTNLTGRTGEDTPAVDSFDATVYIAIKETPAP